MLGLVLWGCGDGDTTGASGSSQTHWLDACGSDAECGDLSCVCGVCVSTCTGGAQCDVSGIATECQTADRAAAQQLCAGRTAVDVCLESCTGEDSCPSGQRCVAGSCLPGLEDDDTGADAGMCTAEGAACTVLEGQQDSDPCCEGSSCAVDTCSDAPAPAPCFGTCQADEPGGMCVNEGDPCSIVGDADDPCCDGSACAIEACTDSIPPNCTGTCTAGAPPPGELRWFTTCGDPVCGPPTDPPPGEGCTTEVEGEACTEQGVSCQTGECGASLICATTDPKLSPGGCPISRAHYKRDIHYLNDSQRRDYADQLMALPLATYRYKSAPDARPQLGFIIEDVEPSASVDAPRDRVDLYGYASMAVATLQVQARELETMRQELALMRQRLAEVEQQCR